MSKKFKSQASSARAATATFPAFGTFQTSSPLSYISEQPDLRSISDPNVVVSLRNLGKKDATTKGKALEELQEYVVDTIETSLLEAWVKTYPRTSIDNSRRVRQLAHSLQGSITQAAGKRVVPYLSKIIGSWLAGSFDNDKAVARAAQDALVRAFPTTDKRDALWKVYKDSLLSYAEDSIIVQTPQTLSDERNTSKDDAEAKYVRVVGSGISLLAKIVERAVPTSTEYDQLISQKKIWEFSYHDDAYLRRSTANLALICSTKLSDSLDWQVISSSFIGKALHSSHLSSARAFTDALLALTIVRPQIWTDDYTSKTAAGKRLRQFLSKGSQMGPEAVWTNIDSLIKVIPKEVIVKDVEEFLEALHKGVSALDEPRGNLPTAWSVYTRTGLDLITSLPNADNRKVLYEKFLLPIVTQSVVPDAKSQSWSLPSNVAVPISCRILVEIANTDGMDLVKQNFEHLTQDLIDSIKLSLPESSREFATSQDSVMAKSARFFRLQQKFDADKNLRLRSEVESVMAPFNQDIKNASIEILKSRNGKPYGAAGVLSDLTSQPLFEHRDGGLAHFLFKDAPSLLQSPSADRLISIALATGHTSPLLSSQLASLSLVDDNSTKATCTLLSGLTLDKFQNELQQVVLDASLSDHYNTQQLSVLSTAFQNPNLQESPALKQIFSNVLAHLSTETTSERQSSGLALTKILVDNRTLTASKNNAPIFPQLLVLGDSANPEIAASARSISQKLKQSSTNSTLELITAQLSGQSVPLSVTTLIELATDFLQASTSETLTTLLPSSSQWITALKPHIHCQKPLSLSITTTLQGVLGLVDNDNSRTQLTYDSEGRSLLFRLVIYTTALLKSSESLKLTEVESVYQHFPIALQLVNEKITVGSANTMWNDSDSESFDEAADLLADGNAVLQNWLQEDAEIPSFLQHWLSVGHQLQNIDLDTYYQALAFTDIFARHVDSHGPSLLLKEYADEFKTLHKTNHPLQAAAILHPCREQLVTSTDGKRILNELIASVTSLKSLSDPSLQYLPLLNIVLTSNDEALEVVPNQRLVFMMKTLIRLLGEVSNNIIATSEALKLLTSVIVPLKDIFGEHWQQIMDILTQIYTSASNLENLPVIHSALRLQAKLKTLAGDEDVNEDLLEAWQSSKPDVEQGLLKCLNLFATPSETIDQPRQITTSLLRRLTSSIKLIDEVPLYPLLSSEDAVQDIAYELLHQYLPSKQEQLSLDLALEKHDIHIPADLLIITNSPNTSSSPPTRDLKPYLLTWHLVFDHFPLASHKLRECYTSDIKASSSLPALLDTICQVLRIADSRPVDASKFDIKSFALDNHESNDKEITWLTTHLYYNCLLYLPSLTKDWFIEQPNRIKSPLESWTQKYISSAIVTASLSQVDAWALTQSDDADDRPVSIKSSPRGSELVASIAVDPESPPIALVISLPGSYPLSSPAVTSRARVGVSDKNWQSWLRTIQIIIFSTGSIIEGLIAFRRNVQAALKGQSECAICYSIIGTDMKTPDKKCGTCRKAFHGTCLFRWFKSSNSSSCPLCRNNFNYA